MSVTSLPSNVTYAARVRLVRRRRAQPHRQRMVEALEAFLDWLEDARQFAVERLDELQGDPDFEPNLGGYMGWDRERECYISDEAEDDDREEDRADCEPSLGSVDYRDQRRWADGGGDDIEWECEDEGAQCEDEGDVSADLPAPDSVQWFTDDGKTVWPPPAAVEEALAEQQRLHGIRSWVLPPGV